MGTLIGRLNTILEEKYPENPDIDYVVRALALGLGDDAWVGLHHNTAEYFPSINDEQRVNIETALRKYLNEKSIYVTSWDKKPEDPVKEAKLLANINSVIAKNYPNNPDTNAIAFNLVFTLGYDAWRALTCNPLDDFQNISDEQRSDIAKELLKLIRQSRSYFTLWNKFLTIDDYVAVKSR